MTTATLDTLLDTLRAEYGFMDADQLAELAALHPWRIVLIRYHQQRERVPACQAARRISYAERLYRWTVRDVSLPTTDPLWSDL